MAPLRMGLADPRRTRRWTEEDTLALARKWGAVFGAPPASIMSIVTIESAHNPKLVNPAREEKGGAWGLGQQMLDEAGDKIGRIRGGYRSNPDVRRTARKWRNDPHDLLDPDLNIMITAWQLGKLTQEFGDFPTVAAAYHQGAGAVRKRIAAGKPPVSARAQPLGTSYVKQALQAHLAYDADPRGQPAFYTY